MSVAERLSSETWLPPWCRHEHFARYRWAERFVAGKGVLDVACGTGYGVRGLLAAGATRYDGFDVNEGAVAEAKQNNAGLLSAIFAIGDVTALPVADESYDVYLSFETIEHVADAPYLCEAFRVVRPDGLFICSTPNRAVTNPGKSLDCRPYNPFHLREYTRDDLSPLLMRHFSSVTFFGQSFYGRPYVALTGAFGRRLPYLAARLHQARKTLTVPLDRASWHEVHPWDDRLAPEVLIAVCRK